MQMEHFHIQQLTINVATKALASAKRDKTRQENKANGYDRKH